MKVYNNVRGTMNTIPNIEVNKDTVYIRSNIKEISEESFKGFEYDEVQYEIKEYVENLSSNQDVQAISMLVACLMSEVDFLKQKINKLEVL
ncbi:hypothetical protein [Clostridium cochlearium]|uniref:hypothetical protein n=1 Tax=Clostridium cochlearium TaxID=1494 RepID=UPI000BBBD95A|nr:hypothetical protein [Clostridium cochlearium]